jgi:enoyl-[acyl-carrier protein] reductase II
MSALAAGFVRERGWSVLAESRTCERKVTMHTRLTELLQVEYPVMLAGMGGISYSDLVIAVSEAGGYGVVGASSMSREKLEVEVAKIRATTEKPFGIDVLTAMPGELESFLPTILDGGATMLVGALGVPRDVIGQLHESGILVASLCGKARHAVAAIESGCDLVIAVGTEAGGHTGTVATFTLVPALVDAVDGRVPVAVGGGVGDGRGLAAALALGADGVWVGTRFVASREARHLAGYTDAIVRSREDDTVITRAYSGKTMRVVRNAWTDYYERHPEELLPFPQQRQLAVQTGVSNLGRSVDAEVDPDREAYLCGQVAGIIHAVEPAADILHKMVADAEDILRRLGGAAR